MKKSFLSGAAIVAAAFAVAGTAHAEDTLKKIKDSGTITEGVARVVGRARVHARRRQVHRLPLRRVRSGSSPTSRSSSAWPSSTSSTSR